MPFPSPGDLPDPRIESRSPTLQADSLPSEAPEKPCDHGNWVNPNLQCGLVMEGWRPRRTGDADKVWRHQLEESLLLGEAGIFFFL